MNHNGILNVENTAGCRHTYGNTIFVNSSRQRTRGLFKKLSDSAIIDGIRSQDDKVLNYLYDHYFQTVRNHVLRNSGSDEDVSDVFQDTIIALFQKITSDDFILTTELKGYFFGIARNIWSAQLRTKRRTEELQGDFPDDDNESDDSLFQRIISRSFSRLKPDCQAVLTMYYDGFSYEEIAAGLKLKNEAYARRKKYLCKETLMEIIRDDPEFREYQRFLK